MTIRAIPNTFNSQVRSSFHSSTAVLARRPYPPGQNNTSQTQYSSTQALTGDQLLSFLNNSQIVSFKRRQNITSREPLVNLGRSQQAAPSFAPETTVPLRSHAAAPTPQDFIQTAQKAQAPIRVNLTLKGRLARQVPQALQKVVLSHGAGLTTAALTSLIPGVNIFAPVAYIAGTTLSKTIQKKKESLMNLHFANFLQTVSNEGTEIPKSLKDMYVGYCDLVGCGLLYSEFVEQFGEEVGGQLAAQFITDLAVPFIQSTGTENCIKGTDGDGGQVLFTEERLSTVQKEWAARSNNIQSYAKELAKDSRYRGFNISSIAHEIGMRTKIVTVQELNNMGMTVEIAQEELLTNNSKGFKLNISSNAFNAEYFIKAANEFNIGKGIKATSRSAIRADVVINHILDIQKESGLEAVGFLAIVKGDTSRASREVKNIINEIFGDKATRETLFREVVNNIEVQGNIKLSQKELQDAVLRSQGRENIEGAVMHAMLFGTPEQSQCFKEKLLELEKEGILQPGMYGCDNKQSFHCTAKQSPSGELIGNLGTDLLTGIAGKIKAFMSKQQLEQLAKYLSIFRGTSISSLEAEQEALSQNLIKANRPFKVEEVSRKLTLKAGAESRSNPLSEFSFNMSSIFRGLGEKVTNFRESLTSEIFERRVLQRVKA
ncbi:MAG: hypothetical protein SFU25_06605 [Candidatus Caenarcaniphilales bacterium]|nr:hypothetical protein [Candidatus Caenarcaniphilales bacterium]